MHRTATLERLAERATRGLLRATLSLPASVLRAAAGPPPRSPEGDALDLQTHALLTASRHLGRRQLHELSVEDARRHVDRVTRIADLPPPVLHAVYDTTVDGANGPLAARCYVPRRGPLPMLLFFHGGGFVVGSLESHDVTCRLLARWGDCIVVAVEYRLAPEHPFPAAIEDSAAAYRWATRHADEVGADRSRIAVGGDSAGGNLAAGVARIARDSGDPPPRFTLLVYPATLVEGDRIGRPLADGFFLDQRTRDWFRGHYRAGREDPRASPLLVDDLAGLPPTLVVTAGFDPICEEGRAYARRLEEAGVSTTYRCEGALIHGFMQLSGVVRAARDATRAIAGDLHAAMR